MSYHPPSFFPQQFDDDLLDLSAFDEDNFNPVFADDEVLEYPDLPTSDQNAFIAKNSFGPYQSQARLPNGEYQPLFDSNEFLEEREELSDIQNIVHGNEPISHEQPQESLPDVEDQSQYEPDEFSKDQGELPGFQDTTRANNSFNYSQPQESPQNECHQYQFVSKQLGKGQEGLPSLQNPTPANEHFIYGQRQAGLPSAEISTQFDLEQFGEDQEGLASGDLENREQEFQFDFDVSDDWRDPANHVIEGSFSGTPDAVADDEQRVQKRLHKAKQTASSKPKSHRTPIQNHIEPIYHAPYSHSELDTSAASPIQQFVGSGQGSVFNTPGIDSGYGTLTPPRNAAFGPYQMSNAIGKPDLGNMYGSLNPAYPSPYQEAYDEEKEDSENEVGEDDEEDAEDDPYLDPAADLNYYAEDPKTGVIESQRRKGWGRTGTRNGVEVWFNPKTEKWQPSASHHSYREILLKRAQAEHPDKYYLYPDETDGLPHGETAFFLPHQNLGPDRDDCPDECFVWPEDEPEDEPEDKEAGKRVQASKKRKPNPRPRGPQPGFWFEDSKVLLDPNNNPVRKHPDMPLTLSAQTEGCKLQLMRLLNAGISQKDEWARMPRWIRRKEPKTDRMIIRYIGSPNTHVNMPSQRFRDEKGTVAGTKRDGTKKIREGLKALFAEYGFDPSLTGSTRGFGRDLLRWEQDLVKLGNTGKHPGRAGETRALDEETRNKNLQKILKKIEKGKKKAEADAAKAGGASGKRPRDNQEGEKEDLNANPQKRVYQNPGMIPSNMGVARNNTKAKSGSRSRKGRGKQASSQTQRYGTHGAAQTSYQSMNTLEAGGRSHYGTYGAAPLSYQNTSPVEGNQQAPSLHSNQSIRSQDRPFYPGIGLENDANLDQSQQESRGQTWSARAPIGNIHYQGGQYQQQHAGNQGNFPTELHQQHGEQVRQVWSPYESNGRFETQYDPRNLSVGKFLTAEPHTSPQNPGDGIQSMPVNNYHHKQAQHEQKSTFDPMLFPPGRANLDPHASQPKLRQGTDNAPIRDLNDFRGESGGYASPQTLGKRDRPHLGSDPQGDSLSSGGKRRRISGTEGYNLPFGTQRRIEKELRGSKRDQHLPAPVFNIDENGVNSQQTSQLAATLQIDEAVPTAYRSPQVSNSQGPDQPHVPVSAPAGQMPASDIRDMPPVTEWECERLQKALECTRWAYEQWTGMGAPETNRFDSYNAQFGVIVNAFYRWWGSESNPERLQPAEWLVQLDPWEGTVADWKPPVADELFYECMRRGFYAPRKEDGSLQHPE